MVDDKNKIQQKKSIILYFATVTQQYFENCTIGPKFDIFTKTFKNLSFKLDRVVDWFLL